MDSLNARTPQQYLNSILFPSAVKTNRNDGLIHILAFIFMFIDHSGKMLFNNMPIMRMIGRLAFPMYAYSVAVGCIFTHDGKKYISRLILLTLISQPLYALGLAHETSAMYAVPFTQNPLLSIWNFYINSWNKPSILLSLCLAAGIILAFRDKNYILALGLFIICHRYESTFDYGIQGIYLILLFYFFAEHPPLCAIVTSLFLITWSASTGSSYSFFGMTFSMEIFALPAVLFCCIPMPRTFKLPRLATYSFYPAHLIVLAICSRL